MNGKVLTDDDGRLYTGQDVLYREKGVTALDVQRAADVLLRRGQKPSIAAVREELGGGSPNTLAPLLEKYWKGLGTRLPAGPESLERVPESLARMTEALWLRSLDEARERAKSTLIGASPAQRDLAALQAKVTELTAALAESRARSSELEAQLLTSLQERVELREQTKRLAALLKAEQEMRARTHDIAEARGRELQLSRSDLLVFAQRKLDSRVNGRNAFKSRRKKGVTRPARSTSNRHAVSGGSRPKQVRTDAIKRGRRGAEGGRAVPGKRRS